MLDLYKVVSVQSPQPGVIVNNSRLSASDNNYYPGARNFATDTGSSNIYLVTEDPEGLKFPYFADGEIKQGFLPGTLNITNTETLTPDTNYTVVTSSTGIEVIPWVNSLPNLLPRGTNTYSFGYSPTPDTNIEGGTISYKEGYRLLNNKVVLGGFRTNSSSRIKDNRAFRMVSNLYNKLPYNLERELSAGSVRVITGVGDYIWDPNSNIIDTTNTTPTLEMFLYEETFVDYNKSINARVDSNGLIALFANWNGTTGNNRIGYETVPIFNTASYLLNYNLIARGFAPRGYNFVLGCINLQRSGSVDPTATFNTLALNVRI